MSRFAKKMVFGALVVASLSHAQDASYKLVSTVAYDQARLIDPNMFARSILLEQFKEFVTRECSARGLARLILAPTKTDLAKAVNVHFFLDDLTSAGIEKFVASSPSLLGQDVSTLNVAQVLCVGGDSAVMIRNGDQVDRYQISGKTDPRKWNAQGSDFTFVGFALHAGAREWISAFIRAKTLPDLEVAASIRDGVEHRTGLPSYLILRTDPFFWDMDGPKFDVLEVSVPRVSGREFLKRPYLSCPPSDDHKPCLLKTSH